jgi:type III restriction enzyme
MPNLDQKIKQAVKDWRDKNYEGITSTSRRLLDFWFKEEHLLEDGSFFNFWRCQKEAIESLIYIYEVCGLKYTADVYRSFGLGIPEIKEDFWSKYCFKMATGSGKTFVMAMALVWQYFNKIYETKSDLKYSSHFLLLAPNLIVFDRLKQDFQDNKIFRKFPFIPKEWQVDFDLQVVFQSAPEEPHSKGILHLTNIQQLYERGESEEEQPIEELLGPKPKREEIAQYEALLNRLQNYEDLMIMNDEAHHVHSDDLKWNKAIAKIHQGIEKQSGDGIVAQLDFSATPKTDKGPFPHIIYDYPLREAIRDKIVKRPRIGIIEEAPEIPTKDFVKKNQIQIDTGIEKLKELQKEFRGTDRKPALFIITDVTTNADKVGKYLEDRGFQDKILVIHTDRKGTITKKDLEKAREAARKIDLPENPYDIIISVMMLKEGWDVKNVCIVVPLRAFVSPILPEQTLGRGLRRMFPDNEDFVERLIVIDHPKFRQLWEAEIKEGELEADITSIERVYQPANRVFVDSKKLKYNIKIPILEGGYKRTLPDISKLDIRKLPDNQFKLEEIEVPPIMYREKDLLEQKIVKEETLSFDYVEIAQLYFSYITNAILSKIGASKSVFNELLPKVKDYIENYLFGEKIDLENTETVKKLNQIFVREKILEVFINTLNELWQFEETPAKVKYFKISQIPLFHTSEPIYEAKKTVFNALPYSKRSEFEKEFMEYVDSQSEVEKFTKIFSKIPLRIPYYEEHYLRHYVPDFVVGARDNFYLIETKGMEEAELEQKMRYAKEWCKKISELTKNKWFYLKISKKDFEKYKTQKFSSLAKFLLPKEELIIVRKEAKKEVVEKETIGLLQRIKNWLVELWNKILK